MLSESQYRESNGTEYPRIEQRDKEKGEQLVAGAVDKAKEARESFVEMIKSLGKKAKTKTHERTKELKDKSIETVDISTKKNTRDIQALVTHAENVVLVYERIMFEIEREDYETQERLLLGYKKLLERQINVIDSKLSIAKDLRCAIIC